MSTTGYKRSWGMRTIFASSFTGKNMTRYIRILQHSRATRMVFQITGLLVMNRGPT